MAAKTKFDIQSENFDNFFLSIINNMTEAQRSLLPKDLQYKIFKSSGKLNVKNTTTLNFLSKAYVLWKAMGVEFCIVAKGKNEEGIDSEEFLKYQKLITDRENCVNEIGTLLTNAVFVLGDKDLADTVSFLNNRSTSPAYKVITKAKNTPSSKVSAYKNQVEYLCRFIVNYEGIKKRLVMEKGLTMPEWYVLMCLYGGHEAHSSTLHKEILRYAYNSSNTQVISAFTKLQNKGMLIKIGPRSTMKLRITHLGTDLVNQIMEKYIIPF